MSENNFFKESKTKDNDEIEVVNGEVVPRASVHKDIQGNIKVIKYCPYCGKELTVKKNEMVCEDCDEVIGFVAEAEEVQKDDFDELLLMKRGKTYGLWMLLSCCIATVITLVSITMTIVYGSSNPEGGPIAYSQILGSSFFSLAGVAWSIVNMIITVWYNYKAKKLGFKRIVSSYIGMWIALVGLLYGLCFLIMVFAGAMNA